MKNEIAFLFSERLGQIAIALQEHPIISNVVIAMIGALQADVQVVIDKHMPYNELTPAEVERLAILTEEMGESLQVVGKMLRHGMEPVDQIHSIRYNNRRDLAIELGQVQHAISLVAAKDVSENLMRQSLHDRFAKIHPYLHHQD